MPAWRHRELRCCFTLKRRTAVASAQGRGAAEYRWGYVGRVGQVAKERERRWDARGCGSAGPRRPFVTIVFKTCAARGGFTTVSHRIGFLLAAYLASCPPADLEGNVTEDARGRVMWKCYPRSLLKSS
ncbi:hypothetical protein EYF80_027340 [Liparis tanakae]|uniref:Uncharacterized protein n=1 Tax=Liparis tanakae TaxID=230148 RepID=A0A4Z2HCC3_9TELE|nr:hypothetical protein EYF80_027340 [Liparis tanakae]